MRRGDEGAAIAARNVEDTTERVTHAHDITYNFFPIRHYDDVSVPTATATATATASEASAARAAAKAAAISIPDRRGEHERQTAPGARWVRRRDDHAIREHRQTPAVGQGPSRLISRVGRRYVEAKLVQTRVERVQNFDIAPRRPALVHRSTKAHLSRG